MYVYRMWLLICAVGLPLRDFPWRDVRRQTACAVCNMAFAFRPHPPPFCPLKTISNRSRVSPTASHTAFRQAATLSHIYIGNQNNL